MKKFLLSFLVMCAFLVVGCNDIATAPTTGNSVSFTMGTNPGTQQNAIIFTFIPSTNITAITLTARLPEQQFEEIWSNPDPNSVFEAQMEYGTNKEFEGVQSGQKWQFVFVGKLGSPSGTDYSQTVNYIIP